MRLSPKQLKTYENEGFLLIREYFSQAEVSLMKAELPDLFSEDSPRRVLEKDSKVVRSVYGSHTTNEVFRRLSQHPRVVEPAMQILGSDVYVYQLKINAKAAFGGDIWEWHQDYVFWRKEDGMPAARVLNATIFLDEVHEFNGPMLIIPGTQKEGVIDVPAHNSLPSAYSDSPAWISNLTADLKYSLAKDTVARMVTEHGIVAPKGPAGSVLFFHGNLVHGSVPNMSPFDRALTIITYNSTENIPVTTKEPRPEFLVSRDQRPLIPLSDDALIR